MKIPSMNLARQNDELRDSYVLALNRLINSSGFILGEHVSAFETDFTAFQQTRYCVGITSGTTALHLVLHACGIGPGDEVISAPNRFAATVETIIYCGTRPVFVDIDPYYYHLDPDRLESVITPRTKAVIQVHH